MAYREPFRSLHAVFMRRTLQPARVRVFVDALFLEPRGAEGALGA